MPGNLNLKERRAQMRYITERSLCSRQFEVEDGADIWVYFWAPYQCDEGGFVCDYMIVGLDRLIALHSYGVDGLDAILGATNQVLRILENDERAQSGRLSWWGFTESFGLYDFRRMMPPGRSETASQ